MFSTQVYRSSHVQQILNQAATFPGKPCSKLGVFCLGKFRAYNTSAHWFLMCKSQERKRHSCSDCDFLLDIINKSSTQSMMNEADIVKAFIVTGILARNVSREG